MVRPIVYIIALIALFKTGIYAQSSDSLVKFKELRFNSLFEENTLRTYFKEGEKADIIDLFLTTRTKKEPYNSKNIHDQISDCVTQLKKETESETEQKKVKAIYKYVHKRFFKVYKLENSFGDIFEKGEYNCVSASALYSIVFKNMGIPFQIVEAPNHVFVVAYPNSHKIFIETTIPDKGYFAFSESYIQKFVKYLYEAKLISKEEYEQKSANELFNAYYFKNNGLSLLELAGIQYSNYYAYFIDEEKYEDAFEEVKKSYCLLKSERNKYLLKSTAAYLVSNAEYKRQEDVKRLVILCRINAVNKKSISDENIRYEYGRIINNQLIKNSNYALFDSSYVILNSSITDTTIKKDIDFYYHYELGRLAYNNLKDKDVVVGHFEKAYKVNPKHADLQNMIRAYVGGLIEKSNDAKAISKMIDEFGPKFSFIYSDTRINSVRANCYLEQSYELVSFNEISKAEGFLNKFEDLMTKYPDTKPTEYYVEKAYSTSASYYFKKGNKTKTRELLKKGISYAPENFGLKIRLQQVK